MTSPTPTDKRRQAIANLTEYMAPKVGQWRYYDGEHHCFTSLPEKAIDLANQAAKLLTTPEQPRMTEEEREAVSYMEYALGQGYITDPNFIRCIETIIRAVKKGGV